MDTKELLKKVRKIEIKTKGLSNHIFSGEYHSAFKGRGMSFSEVREYQYGDDVRSIDWNVTARFNHPFVKVFEEERELTVLLLIDISRSALFGSRTQFKQEIIAEIAAVLAFSAIQNNDKVGAILFSDRVEQYIPPKKGRHHILRIIRELIDTDCAGTGTDMAEAIRFFQQVTKKRSIAFLLSDFLCDGYEKELHMAARRHDIVGIQVYDLRDKELPPVGLLRARDAETGTPLWIDTASASTRQLHQQQFLRWQQYMSAAFLTCGKEQISIQSGQSYITPLMNLFKRREGR